MFSFIYLSFPFSVRYLSSIYFRLKLSSIFCASIRSFSISCSFISEIFLDESASAS